MREIVFPRIEEHAFEQGGRRFQRRRIAGTKLAINLDERFLSRLDRVLAQSLAQHHADVIAFREEHRQFRNAGVDDAADLRLRQLVVGFDDDLAGIRVDDIGDGKGAFEILRRDFKSSRPSPA